MKLRRYNYFLKALNNNVTLLFTNGDNTSRSSTSVLRKEVLNVI